MNEPDQELICVARIARSRGIRGEVIADLLTDFPERFNDLTDVVIKLADQSLIAARLEQTRFFKGRAILKFAGFDTVERAEELRGAGVMITSAQLVKLPAETWYHFDLIGCEIADADGAVLGQVTKVEEFGAAPLLTMKTQDGREVMIPFVASICTEVDIANKRIVVNLPEGLLEL